MTTSSKNPYLIEALKYQRQLDWDGVMVGVSRQAVDEAIELVENLETKNRAITKQLGIDQSALETFRMKVKKLETELASYTAAEVNDSTAWPMIEKQAHKITELKAENERLKGELIDCQINIVGRDKDAERFRKCIKFGWLHPDYDPTGHSWE